MNSKLWKIAMIAAMHVLVIGGILLFESCKPKAKAQAPVVTPPPGTTATGMVSAEVTPPPAPPVPVTTTVASPVETKPLVAAVATSTTHAVVKGDTLSGLAHKHGTTVAAIKRVNNLSSDTIRIGQKLTIPGPQESSDGKGVSEGKAPAGKSTAAKKKTSAKPAAKKKAGQAAAPAGGAAEGGAYIVVAGDTPDKIAKKAGVKLQALMDANPGLDPRKLKIGQKLNVPGGAAAGGTAPAMPTAPSTTEQPVPLPVPTPTTPSAAPTTESAPPPAPPAAAPSTPSPAPAQ